VIFMTGCTVGIKEKRTLVMVSPVPIPQAAQGAPMIATNKPIALVILNREGDLFKENIGGYVVVDPQFYGLLIEAYRKDVDARSR